MTSTDTNRERQNAIALLLRKDNLVSSVEKIDERILNKLVELCNLHHLTPEVMVNKINAVMLTENIQKLGAAIPRLEVQLQSSAAAMQSKAKPTQTMGKKQSHLGKDGMSSVLSRVKGRKMGGKKTKTREIVSTGAKAAPQPLPKNPLAKKPLVTETVEGVEENMFNSSKAYSERTNSADIVLHFNKELDVENDGSKPAVTTIEPIGGILDSTKFLYMYDKLQHRSEYISDRLISLGEELLEKYDLGYSQPVGTVLGSKSVYVGRILTESINGDDRLNMNSILLEGFGDETTEKSKIVRLRMDRSVKHSFFPGQIVAVQGTMNDGELVVNDIYSDTQTSVDYEPDHITRNTNIMVACGPFTTDDNVLFQPLKDLMKRVEDEKPDALILIGPFVPKNNVAISLGKVDESYDDIFERCITDVLASLPINTQLVLVPSLTDMHHDYVYPQPAFDLKQQLGINDSRVHCLSNPSILRINGVTVGVNAFDILSRLVSTTYASKAYSGLKAREVQAVEHCISQRSYYPPSIPTEHMPLDFSHANRMEFKQAPSILILPSKLPFVVEEVNNVLFINPQSLFVDAAAGLYANITIRPESNSNSSADGMDVDSNEQSTPKRRNITQHTSVKLTRI